MTCGLNFEGLRVIRGKDWCWGDRDGGEGGVGTVIRDANGFNSTKEDAAVVLWDNGYVSDYNIGRNNKFDLLVYDSGPAGIHHKKTSCSHCCSKIWGMMWVCFKCPEVFLCGACYMSDVHASEHAFYRHDHPSTLKGELVPARSNSLKLGLKGIFTNSRVVRGLHWEWFGQDGSKGNRGTVKEIRDWENESGRSVARVAWDRGIENIYRIGHYGKVDLKLISCPLYQQHCYPEHLPILCSSFLKTLRGTTKTPCSSISSPVLSPSILMPSTNTNGMDSAKRDKLVKKVSALLTDLESDVNQQDENGDTLLHTAIQYGARDIISRLINSHAVDPTICNNKNEDCLQQAAGVGNSFAIEDILDKWPHLAKVNRPNSNSALYLSCICGYLEATKCLVEKGGAEINAVSPAGFTPLYAAIEADHSVVAEFLVNRGADLKYLSPQGENYIELALDKIKTLEYDKNVRGEISLFIDQISPMFLSLYPGLPLACLMHRKGATYNDNNLSRDVKDMLMTLAGNSSNPREHPSMAEMKPSDENVEMPYCIICEEERVKVAFQCGHMTCQKCSLKLKNCHMCSALISQRFNIYF